MHGDKKLRQESKNRFGVFELFLDPSLGNLTREGRTLGKNSKLLSACLKIAQF